MEKSEWLLFRLMEKFFSFVEQKADDNGATAVPRVAEK